MNLERWIAEYAHKFNPITTRAGYVGIHDTADIESGYSRLFWLTDYRVWSVSGGVIWLVQK